MPALAIICCRDSETRRTGVAHRRRGLTPRRAQRPGPVGAVRRVQGDRGPPGRRAPDATGRQRARPARPGLASVWAPGRRIREREALMRFDSECNFGSPWCSWGQRPPKRRPEGVRCAPAEPALRGSFGWGLRRFSAEEVACLREACGVHPRNQHVVDLPDLNAKKYWLDVSLFPRRALTTSASDTSPRDSERCGGKRSQRSLGLLRCMQECAPFRSAI